MLEKDQRVVLVGGGLANGLIAYLLTIRRPDVDVRVIEQGDALGGCHTWSFHGSDLARASTWVHELCTKSWDGYDVRFPSFTRTIHTSYHSVRSADFHVRLWPLVGACTRLRTRVREVATKHVVLGDGTTLNADLVVDGRGLAALEWRKKLPCAYQKFYGLFVKTAVAHGFVRPLLMDARVDQLDGYRFVYALPWSEDELLVEDTRYSDIEAIDERAMHGAVMRYLGALGLADGVKVVGIESAALPIPFHGAEPPTARDGVLLSGSASGLFHPTTGYSLPEAVRFAEILSSQARLGDGVALRVMADYARTRWRDGAFFRRLNNMFFRAAEPTGRRRVIEQFYRRNERLIARFYRGEIGALDRLRILSGRPPLPLGRGLLAFFERIAVG